MAKTIATYKCQDHKNLFVLLYKRLVKNYTSQAARNGHKNSRILAYISVDREINFLLPK